MPEPQSFNEWVQEEFGDDAQFYPVDLAEVAEGDLTPPEPTILRRSDGHGLIYPGGKLHWIAGLPEAGKSWFALLAVKDVVENGGQVVYFDYEMSKEDLTRRLLALGVRKQLLRQVHYVRHRKKMTDEKLMFYGKDQPGAPALFGECDLVVFDACTAAMAVDGYDPNSNADVAAWLDRAPWLATAKGASVLVLDHVTKDKKTRDRWAIGAQNKQAQTDVHYSLFRTQAFWPGATGLAAIVVEKDRHAGIRPHAVAGRKAGTLVLNAEHALLEGFVAAPTEDEGPTRRMEEILEFARRSVEPLSKNELESAVGGRGATNRQAVTTLIADGTLIRAPGHEDKARPKWVVAPEENGEVG